MLHQLAGHDTMVVEQGAYSANREALAAKHLLSSTGLWQLGILAARVGLESIMWLEIL